MRPTTVARTVTPPVFSPACRAGATATPELLVATVATFSPPVKVVSVSPMIVKRTLTLPTALPAFVSARVLIRLVNASPAMAVSFAVPASSRWSTVSVFVGGVDGGVVGVEPGSVGGFGVVVPPPGFSGLGLGLGFEPPGAGVVGVFGVFGVEGEGLAPAPSSLRLPGNVPVPSGISCVPLR